MRLLPLFVLAFPVASWGQACPPEAIHSGIVSQGRQLEIAAIHTEDAYASSTEIGPGDLVTVVGSLHQNGDCWYGGEVETTSGASFYFYKVALAQPGVRCVATALDTAPLRDGEVVVVSHHEDAVGDELLPVGERVRAVDEWRVENACWMRGTAQTSEGARVRFANISFARAPSTHARCDPSVVEVSTGTRVVIRGLHARDPYAAVAEQLEGRVLTLERVLSRDGCWYSALLRDDGGVRYRTERAALSPAPL